MGTNKAGSVNKLYTDRSLYSSSDMFSPPSERLSRVIRFELTNGCNWARCTYCGGYDGIKYEIKSIDEYKEHVEEVWKRIGRESDLAKSLKRVFIGGGNALEVETDILNEAIQYTGKRFTENTGSHARRISLYGRTDDILHKGRKGLMQLKYGRKRRDRFIEGKLPNGLDLIYWGVESGSTDVLDYVNKGCTKRGILKASKIINSIPIETSVMIMPGLGGKRFYKKHIRNTAKVLGKIKPKFLTFMGINPASGSRYSGNMAEEQRIGSNRPLTNRELATQMVEIIKKMPTFRTKIGCFGCDVDSVGFNSLTFKFNLYGDRDKNYLVRELGAIAAKIEDSFTRDDHQVFNHPPYYF